MPAQTSCPEAERLSQLAEGHLPTAVVADLEQHVLQCDDCAKTLDRLCVDETLMAGIQAQATTPLQIDPQAESLVQKLRRKTVSNEVTEGGSGGDPHSASVDAEFLFLAPPQAPDEIGRLGPYRVLQVLGKGGMGVVFKAEDARLNRLIALKAMLPEMARRPEMKERFLREAQAAARIEHDNIIPIYQVDEDRGVPYIAMPFLKGASLEDYLKQKQRLGRAPLTVPQILKLAGEITRGLGAAHEKGMIHRDIKPANIWLDGSAGGRVRILDFGLARLTAAAGEQHLTQSGSIMGTPSYMAPEQARAEKLDHRADLFSLGVVLYRLCTGELPFKGSDPISTLMALAMHDPTPPAELNATIPAELSKLVMRLLAKDPQERTASASQVLNELQLIAGGLPAAVESPGSAVSSLSFEIDRASVASLIDADWPAHLQASTFAADTRTQAPAIPSHALKSSRRPPHHRRPAGLAALAGGFLAIVAAAIFYVETSKGTIRVEIYDPAIEVTIKGTEFKFTGADPHTVGVKPGEGEKTFVVTRGPDFSFETDQLILKKWGRAVVKVELLDGEVRVSSDGKLLGAEKIVSANSASPGATNLAKVGGASSEPFVVLDGQYKEAHKCSTLADAVAWGVNGDTIEIRGDGPFVTRPIAISGKALTIRAGANYEPVLRLDREGVKANADLLTTDAPLFLEGLELQRLGNSEPMEGRYAKLVEAANSLTITNCRLLQPGRLEFNAIACWGQTCVVRNCIILTMGTGLMRSAGPGRTTTVDNCVLACGGGMSVWGGSTDISRNTILANYPFAFFHWHAIPDIDEQPGAAPAMRWRSSDNVLHANHFVLCFDFVQENKREAKEALLRGFMAWEEQSNVYQAETPFLNIDYAEKPSLARLSDWEQFWGLKNTGATQGRIRYVGGDIWSRMKASPETLVPADFRLHADSAGKGAGPGGKDLGADVDLVGPGKAYERWKKTPEYQEWIKKSGQVVSEAERVEPFVILANKAGAERKFATLPEAVQAAQNRDTIEIRSDGPFVTRPIAIEGKALNIRAGVNYQPVLQLDPEGVKANAHFLTSDAPLVLEGLELQHLGKSDSGEPTCLVNAMNNLSVANCRFLWHSDSPTGIALGCWGNSCEVRNCIVLGPTAQGMVRHTGPARTTSVENCVFACPSMGLGVFEFQDRIPAGSHNATRNTILASYPFGLWQHGALPDLDKQTGAAPSIRWNSTENVVQAHEFVFAFDFVKEQPSEGKEALLRQLMAWEERGNVYQAEMPFLGIIYSGKPSLAGLHDWNQFWGLKNASSAQGGIRYTGGDIWARMIASPETLVPADFRLHPDSAGKGAGADGKDLGADVDLVGPGPAYECWKKTPEYQEWLKQSGQAKALAAVDVLED